ncbi:DNA alkylation repair protein [Candidatus Woesearchaeota archaeon]|nr:DNA alkylation repair protein [Candidatus Woesearchaeota archaeon]
MNILSQLLSDMQQLANPEKAKLLSGFFKTGKGEYGEGDIFWGIVVPEQRKIAQKYIELSLPEIQKLLSSKIHEHRLTALIILTLQYKKEEKEKGEQEGEKTREKIFNFYLNNTKYINNWDLVDLSAPNIVGSYLLHKDSKDRLILYKLAKSHLWDRRISILATFTFIKNNQLEDSLKLAEILLNDKHDLIHKAVGWMLREIGKRDQSVEEKFLNKHYQTMPRTMLRYAIEKFDEKKKRYYMRK